jgi:hypothetical protein
MDFYTQHMILNIRNSSKYLEAGSNKSKVWAYRA